MLIYSKLLRERLPKTHTLLFPLAVTANQGKETLKPSGETQKGLPIIGGAQIDHQSQQQQQQQASAIANANSIVQTTKSGAKPTNNAEKLKRGLTSFMNQLNPASFFVPAVVQPGLQQQALKGELGAAKQPNASKTQTSAETAAIVNGDPTADVLIKGPNRLSQTRPIGGPLRWG